MTEIPEDIREKAEHLCRKLFGGAWLKQAEDDIARALLAERQSATSAERERCAKIVVDNADIASKIAAQGWRMNPNMSGDDRDFMGPMQRRRHDERIAEALAYIATAIRGGSHDQS